MARLIDGSTALKYKDPFRLKGSLIPKPKPMRRIYLLYGH